MGPRQRHGGQMPAGGVAPLARGPPANLFRMRRGPGMHVRMIRIDLKALVQMAVAAIVLYQVYARSTLKCSAAHHPCQWLALHVLSWAAVSVLLCKQLSNDTDSLACSLSDDCVLLQIGYRHVQNCIGRDTRSTSVLPNSPAILCPHSTAHLAVFCC